MKFRYKKALLILICLFNLYQALEPNKKTNNRLRKTWVEEVKYEYHYNDSAERESLEKCEASDYKFFIHFVAGDDVVFEKYINKDNAVSKIVII